MFGKYNAYYRAASMFTLKSETIKDANYVCRNCCEIVNHSAVQETIIKG
jgi:hypothetical protein